MVAAYVALIFFCTVVVAFQWGRDIHDRRPWCEECEAASRHRHPGGSL